MHEWLQPSSGVLHWGRKDQTGDSKLTSQLYFNRYSHHDYAVWGFSAFNKAAYVSNALLGAIESSTAPENVKKWIEGEGHFVRAASYFYLVRIYGDISIAKVPPTTIAEVCTPRTNFWEVYNFILEDLTTAFDLMASYDEMVAMAGGNASGRVCNYGAKAMRSLVYLTIGTLLEHPNDNFWVNRTPEFKTPDGEVLTAKRAFELALADADDVIKNGPFELAPSYGQLFRWGGRDKAHPGEHPEDFQLKERIFVIPRTAEGIGSNNTSLQKWSLPPYYNGTSGSTASRCIPTRWEFQKWCDTYGGIKGKKGEANENIYVDCGDPRMKISFAYNSFIGQKNAEKKLYPYKNNITRGDNNAKNITENVVYNIKYYDATYDNNTGSADFYVMRYAEVFLIAAEAAAYLDKTSDAIGYINKLLARARRSGDGAPGSVVPNYEGTGTCAEPADWTASKFKSKEDLLTAIFWERCFELNFECHEYFDTHRCGAQWIVDHISKPKNAFLDQPEQDTYWIKFCYGTGNPQLGNQAADGTFRYLEDPVLVRKGLISGFPVNELQNNTELDQNLYDPNYGQNPLEVLWE